MVSIEEKKRQIWAATKGVRYSAMPEYERQNELYKMICRFAESRGYKMETEAFKIHAKAFDEAMMMDNASMPWDEVELALNYGFVHEEFGEYERVNAQNMARVVRKYLDLDERKSVWAEIKRQSERRSDLEEWEINLKNWNALCRIAKDAWESYVTKGTIGDYRSKDGNRQIEWDRMLTRIHLHDAYQWLKVNNIIFESPSRMRTCFNNAEKEYHGSKNGLKAYASSLALEWEYLEAKKSGRDIGAEIDRKDRETSDSERMKIKIEAEFAFDIDKFVSNFAFGFKNV